VLAAANAPVFARGDCWTYANSEWPNPAGNALRLREWISRIMPEGEIEMTSGPKDRGVRIRPDSEGNDIRKYTWSFEPNEADLRFPLAVGKNWHASYVVHPADSAPPSQQETDFKVERTVVPGRGALASMEALRQAPEFQAAHAAIAVWAQASSCVC
jgi:hypothetical protein